MNNISNVSNVSNVSNDVYTVYTRLHCTYCDKVKELLYQNNRSITIIECDTMLENDRTSFLDKMDSLTFPSVHRTFPYVFKGSVFIGGFDDTEIYEVGKESISDRFSVGKEESYTFNDDNF